MSTRLDFCICEEDTLIKLDPEEPSTSKTSKWFTGASSSNDHLWVLKAGSAYYHFSDTHTNYWLQEEVDHARLSLHTSGITCFDEGNGNDAKVVAIREEKLTKRNRFDVVHEICILDLKRPNSEKRNPVLRFDIKRILNGWRLDDGIMNNYIGMLNFRIRNKSMFIMDTYHMVYLGNFENILEEESEDEHIDANIKERNKIINKWGFDLKENDLILIPIHSRQKTHWELWVLDFKFKCIRFYDSKDCGGPKFEYIYIMERWVRSIWECSIYDWRQITVSKLNGYNIPSQGENNVSDCGVFVLKYIESIVSGKPLRDMREIFNEGDSRMKEYRTNLAKELLCN